MKLFLTGLLMSMAVGFTIGESALADNSNTTQPHTNYLAYSAYRCYWSVQYGRRICGYYHGGYYGGGYYNGYHGGYYNHGYYNHGYYNHGNYNHRNAQHGSHRGNYQRHGAHQR